MMIHNVSIKMSSFKPQGTETVFQDNQRSSNVGPGVLTLFMTTTRLVGKDVKIQAQSHSLPNLTKVELFCKRRMRMNDFSFLMCKIVDISDFYLQHLESHICFPF
ncbi:hypothetical protein AMECASPLE_021196 [Ameca splendens]|uniref:Uncharacterized protein n=1 Tax=Ameca splendens TaxID=208324 RepID=A0ABV0Y3Z5_9TELE